MAIRYFHLCKAFPAQSEEPFLSCDLPIAVSRTMCYPVDTVSGVFAACFASSRTGAAPSHHVLPHHTGGMPLRTMFCLVTPAGCPFATCFASPPRRDAPSQRCFASPPRRDAPSQRCFASSHRWDAPSQRCFASSHRWDGPSHNVLPRHTGGMPLRAVF